MSTERKPDPYSLSRKDDPYMMGWPVFELARALFIAVAWLAIAIAYVLVLAATMAIRGRAVAGSAGNPQMSTARLAAAAGVLAPGALAGCSTSGTGTPQARHRGGLAVVHHVAAGHADRPERGTMHPRWTRWATARR